MTTDDLAATLIPVAAEPIVTPEATIETTLGPAAEPIVEGTVAEPHAESAVTSEPPPEIAVASEPPAEVAIATEPLAEVAVVTEPVVAAPTPVAPPAAAKPQPTPEQLARQEEGRKRAAAIWTQISGAKESGESIQGKVRSEVKGGLILDVDGFRAFLPASQTRVAKGDSLASLVNTTISVKVLDVDEKRKRLVVSHRRAAEADRRAARVALLQSLKIGENREARVVRLADFGAFVDLGGVDALVPIGELAFERVDKPSDVVAVGDQFTVRVMRIDEGGKKIAVSRKGALPDPWRDYGDLLHTGNVVEGKVVGKEPRLQVEIAPGVIGSISDREADPAEYEIGESIEVTVRSVDYRNRRLRLGTLHAANTFSASTFAPLGKELGV